MAFFDFLYRRKITAKHYFNETSKQLDLPGIGVRLSKLKSTADINVQVGEAKSHRKITIPESGDVTKLAQLDMMQYQLASSINTLKGKSKQEKTAQYVDALLQMFQLVSGDSTRQENQGNLTANTDAKNSSNIQVQTSFDCSNLKSFLDEREFRSYFLPNNLCEGGTLLWPMNVQDNVTYIHAAQFQLVKLFILAGWKLRIIIGDCGHNSSKSTAYTDFKRAIEAYLTNNGVSSDKYKVYSISQYFIRNNGKINENNNDIEIDQLELLHQFHSISDSIQWKDYKEEILKEYDNETKDKIEGRKILNNIQPLLMWSIVASINQYNVNNNSGKVIVVAGADEDGQWKRIANTYRKNNLGVILIQVLKTTDGKTMNQAEIKISDRQMLQDKINSNENLAKWLYLHFIELPKFHTKPQQFPFCNISKSKCKDFNDNCIKCLFESRNYDTQEFDKSEYVKHMYPLINSAN